MLAPLPKIDLPPSVSVSDLNFDQTLKKLSNNLENLKTYCQPQEKRQINGVIPTDRKDFQERLINGINRLNKAIDKHNQGLILGSNPLLVNFDLNFYTSVGIDLDRLFIDLADLSFSPILQPVPTYLGRKTLGLGYFLGCLGVCYLKLNRAEFAENSTAENHPLIVRDEIFSAKCSLGVHGKEYFFDLSDSKNTFSAVLEAEKGARLSIKADKWLYIANFGFFIL
ncbi:hypothetical protein [Helicobacter suis]|uniref:hypothetical protein n=1 Tax=Helicobacter suis TaxID=104628 RepID=UPI0013D25106|nr:hypothetical protein [Helicobacter suis]